MVGCVDAFLDRADGKAKALQPSEPMRAGNILPEHQMYVAVMEQARYVRRLRNRIIEHAERKRPTGVSSSIAHTMRSRSNRILVQMGYGPIGNLLQELMAADSVKAALREMEQASDTDTSDRTTSLTELTTECALLEQMLNGKPDSRVLLCCLATDNAVGGFGSILSDFYRPLF